MKLPIKFVLFVLLQSFFICNAFWVEQELEDEETWYRWVTRQVDMIGSFMLVSFLNGLISSLAISSGFYTKYLICKHLIYAESPEQCLPILYLLNYYMPISFMGVFVVAFILISTCRYWFGYVFDENNWKHLLYLFGFSAFLSFISPLFCALSIPTQNLPSGRYQEYMRLNQQQQNQATMMDSENNSLDSGARGGGDGNISNNSIIEDNDGEGNSDDGIEGNEFELEIQSDGE